MDNSMDDMRKDSAGLAWTRDTNGSPCNAFIGRRYTGRFRGLKESL